MAGTHAGRDVFSFFTQVKIHHEDRALQFRPEDATVYNLSRIFHLIPDTTILISDEGVVCVPDSHGKFDLDCFRDYTIEGDKSSIGMCGSNAARGLKFYQDEPCSSTTLSAASNSNTTWKPKVFSSKGKTSAHTNATTWQKSIETWHFSLNGKFVQQSEHPVNMTESTATVPSVSEKLSVEAFSGKEVQLLNSKNLLVPDVEGTRGMKFWRTSKVIKAVSGEDFEKLERQRNPPPMRSKSTVTSTTLDSPDSDFEIFDIPVTKHRRRSLKERLPTTCCQPAPLPAENVDPEWILKLMNKMDTIRVESLDQAREIKEIIKNQALSQVNNIFTCIICKSILSSRSNFVVTPCCQAVLSCRECLQQWLENSNTCPNCREVISLDHCLPIPVIRPLVGLLNATQQN